MNNTPHQTPQNAPRRAQATGRHNGRIRTAATVTAACGLCLCLYGAIAGDWVFSLGFVALGLSLFAIERT